MNHTELTQVYLSGPPVSRSDKSYLVCVAFLFLGYIIETNVCFFLQNEGFSIEGVKVQIKV